MSEATYMISEAAKQVAVESHVLRYWEDELALKINRNQQGHRYYTKKDIQLFACISKLKDEGLSLKEIRAILPDLISARDRYHLKHHTSKNFNVPLDTNHPQESTNSNELSTTETSNTKLSTHMDVFTENNLKEMRSLIGAVVSEAVAENNQTLKREICDAVTNDVLKEMDEFFTTKERREEEHYRKLDSLIRQQQAYRKESTHIAPFQFIATKMRKKILN